MTRWEPPTEQVVETPKPRRWPVVLLLLAILGVAGAGMWMLQRQLRPPNRSDLTMATNVQSDITAVGDSLLVVVRWRLPSASSVPAPDSVRVEVGLGDGRQSTAEVIPGNRLADTLRLTAPAAGETAAGYSCAAPVHGERLARESCTPWQFVRPAAQVPATPPAPLDSAARPKRTAAQAGAAAIVRIVVEPDGQQVDPDVHGRCEAWQRRNPGRAIWLDVNHEAIPECTGPNGKPTIAKFCAFAVLADGRRVKTENSSNDIYCERLYQTWVRERVA